MLEAIIHFQKQLCLAWVVTHVTRLQVAPSKYCAPTEPRLPYRTRARFENLNFKQNMSADLTDHSSSSCSSPELPSESRGSSVSPGLREEYEDILKYAVVAPKLLGESSSLSQPPRPSPPTPTALDTRCEGIPYLYTLSFAA